MNNLLKAITNYLSQDLNKMEELNNLLSSEITNLKMAKKEQKKDNLILSLEENLKNKMNEKENKILKLKEEFKNIEDYFLKVYGDRIKRIYNIYFTLDSLDKKQYELGLPRYSQMLKSTHRPMYFSPYQSYKLCFHYEFKGEFEKESIIINSIFYFSYNKEKDDLTININNRNEYNCDNNYTLAIKDVLTIKQMIIAFEKFEKDVNELVEKILEG